MMPGDAVVMNHPEGYATVFDGGSRFIGWIPNGVAGVVYVRTPSADRVVVHFEDKLIATVAAEHLRVVAEATYTPVA